MPPVVGDAVREAERVIDLLDRLQATLEEIRVELRRWAQARGEDLVVTFFPEERRDAARALVRRALAIMDEVAAWAATQGPAGLLNKLVPQLKEAVGELQTLLMAPTTATATSSPAHGVGNGHSQGQGASSGAGGAGGPAGASGA